LEYVGFVQPQEEKMIAVYGKPGTGKTTAGRWMAENRNDSNGVTAYVRSGPFMSNYAFAQLLCESVGQSETSLIRAMNLLTQKLEASDILIVDECDSLSDKCLEMLRTIHDMTSATVVMMGELSFYSKIAKHSRLFDRTTHCEFSSLTLQDAILLSTIKCRGVELAEDLIAAAHQEAEGNARRLSKVFGFIQSHCVTKGWENCDLKKWNSHPFRSDLAKLPNFVGRKAA
jgi:DNA transposition AAA+ family ATPase